MRETNNEGLYQSGERLFGIEICVFPVKPDSSPICHGAWVTVHNGQNQQSRISRHEGREAGGQAG